MQLTSNTPIWQLTVGEFVELIQKNIHPAEPVPMVRQDTEDAYVYKIDGIAKLLGVSKTQVYKFRKEGWLEPAIDQYGRKIICNKELAKKLFGERGRKSKRFKK
jgi:hypothetical protein